MKEKLPLTDTQKKYFDFIENYFIENGYMPTLREISEYFLVSITTSQWAVEQLVEKRYLKKFRNKERGIAIRE